MTKRIDEVRSGNKLGHPFAAVLLSMNNYIQAKQPKTKLPLLTVMMIFLFSVYFLIFFSVRIYRMIVELHTGEELTTLSWLVGESNGVYLIAALLIAEVAAVGFLISTRVKVFENKHLRVSGFLVTVGVVWSGFVSYGMWMVDSSIIPFFEEKLDNVIPTDAFVEAILFDYSSGFYMLLLLLPIILLGFISLFLLAEFGLYSGELKEAFFKYEYKGKWLQKFSKLEEKEIWPDVELGLSIKTNEMVIIPGFDRTLNSLIVGTIGTGKTAALGLPVLNQDLHHMTRYINDFPKISKRKDFMSKDVSGRYLSGITVIEPSNDLCKKALKLVKAHGIPDEAITYINPLDPNTPNINPMRGPVDKVAEVFAQIIAGLNDSGSTGNFFFEQAQRNHLKQHIYLLKLHDPELQVSFDMLIDMYNNPNYVHQMHLKLKTRIPENIDSIEEKQERNYWKIIQGIDEWFDLTIIPKVERRNTGSEQLLVKPEAEVFMDAKSEFVQGLRNILNDIGSNPYIRNVLFGESEFDFDEHFAKGGVLLVNTAKGQLVDLARVLGKIVLMNLQNATFRRPEEGASFHHIMVDESPDYFYDAFSEFPVQSRKYKVIITTIMQTIAQMADRYGEHYMTTLIAGMRNRMVYGDVPAYDAEYFSKLFGEKIVFDEGQTEMSVSPLQEDPMTRGGSSFQKVREQSMTSGEIMFQDAFNCAVKVVVNNKPMPVQQIKANFVPAEEFEKAVVVAEEEAVEKWVAYRLGIEIETEQVIENAEDELVEVEGAVADRTAEVAAGDELLQQSLISTDVSGKNSLPAPVEDNKGPLPVEKDPRPLDKEINHKRGAGGTTRIPKEVYTPPPAVKHSEPAKGAVTVIGVSEENKSSEDPASNMQLLSAPSPAAELETNKDLAKGTEHSHIETKDPAIPVFGGTKINVADQKKSTAQTLDIPQSAQLNDTIQKEAKFLPKKKSKAELNEELDREYENYDESKMPPETIKTLLKDISGVEEKDTDN